MSTRHPRRSSDPARPPRRQNKSCDQCRNGKRRCDVQISTSPHSKTPDSPCTNCTKWRKRCTVAWVASLERRRSQLSGPGLPSIKPSPSVTANTCWWPPDAINTPFLCHDDDDFPLDGHSGGLLFSETSFESDDFALPSLSAQSSSESSSGLLELGTDTSSFLATRNGDLVHTGQAKPWSDVPDGLSSQWTSSGITSSHMPEANGSRLSPMPRNAANCFESYLREVESTEEKPCRDPWQQNKYDPDSSNQITTMDRVASPFTSQILSQENSRLTIKEGLMKIYHDSMEGALSCWLTERNCPYSSVLFDGSTVWSSDWANRIVTRVCDMDRAYSTTGSLPARDQQQASRVLNLVVMAFASQWSQTSHGRDACTSAAPAGPSSHQRSHTGKHGDELADSDDEVFGRNMQKTLWQQASRALCEASENTSFRVILAGIIFSLTQRPIDPGEFQGVHADHREDLALLYTILDHDGPPIVLDIALRKLHDHQRRFEDARYACADGLRTSRAWPQLSDTHKQTFGLLYWLAVMFDTLSAAVNRRPFAISDTDSNSIHTETVVGTSMLLGNDFDINVDIWSELPSTTYPALASRVDVWGTYFLDQHSRAGDIRKQDIRWPCSYNDAASCLADAAPVKVLLFRRVAQLQNLVYNHPTAAEVEKGIEAVMEVYDHWESTYGRFIDDCIQHHEDLPARIQSWYILLAGHWNLAIFILSDLIDKLDTAQRTMPFDRGIRQLKDSAGALRARSAFTVSELGRCSRYGAEDLSFSKSPDFHHAVNKAALLTEPWTMVLVRSFGYAGAIFAKQVTLETKSGFGITTSCTAEARERLQYCIDALSLLGKKSGMAMCAAQVLQKAARNGLLRQTLQSQVSWPTSASDIWEQTQSCIAPDRYFDQPGSFQR